MSLPPLPLLGRLLGTALLAGVLAACDSPRAQTEQTRSTSASAPARPRAPTVARDQVSGLSFIAVTDLPREGQRTLSLIRAGGPFPYRKDGSVFGNREGVLPGRPGGRYREYTVPTPGEGDRGARRIVCVAVKPPTPADAECYYSADHYTTFRRIQP